MCKTRLTISFLVLLVSTLLNGFAQTSPENSIKKLGPNPVYYLDSVLVDSRTFHDFNPTNIAAITILTEKEAIDHLGDKGKDGIVLLESKEFAKKKFWKYFSSKSSDYALHFPTIESDVSVQYILNEKVLTSNFEGNLSSINDHTFLGLQIISKKELRKKYKVKDRELGILIQSKEPDNL